MDNEKKRINVEDLPRPEEELTDEEAKNVEGGLTKQGQGTLTLSSSNSLTSGNTVGGSLANDPSRTMGDGSV